MKIIILGAGRVGQAVADSLVIERNDITVIDTNRDLLRDLESRYDLRGVAGNGVDPAVLAEAGAKDTDLLIACAENDETNLVCCKVAHKVFGIPTRIARVRSSAWANGDDLLGPDGFSVTYALHPEDSMTRYLVRLLEFPGALQVREFAHGLALLIAVRARATAPLVGKTIAEIRAGLPELPMRIVAIYRRYADEPDRFIHCDGIARIEPGDEVYVLASRQDIQEILLQLSRPAQAPVPSVRRIMIVDGGIVALKLAQALTQQRKGYYRIKVVERDETASMELSEKMPDNVLLFRAEGTDESFLEEESIEEVDMLLALSNDDENNILACLLAKRMGAKRVLALINQRSYADLMHGTQIDIALTPAQAMLGELLTHVRQGDVQAVHSLRRGVAEALEIVVRGDARTSRVVGRKVGELKLPRDVHLGLIARGLKTPPPTAEDAPAAEDTIAPAGSTPGAGNAARETPDGQPGADTASEVGADEVHVIFPRRDTVIQSNDHIVFFVPHKRLVREVEKAFSVKPIFF